LNLLPGSVTRGTLHVPRIQGIFVPPVIVERILSEALAAHLSKCSRWLHGSPFADQVRGPVLIANAKPALSSFSIFRAMVTDIPLPSSPRVPPPLLSAPPLPLRAD